MKRTIFTILAAFALVLAMPAVAQQDLEDTRTNPDADSIAPGSGLTLEGTVVEWNDEQLVLRTATGIEHIQLVPQTDRPVEFEVGENVSVDYTRTGQGVMIAQKIRPQGELAEPSVDTTATSDLTVETETEAELQAEVETDVTTEDELETDVTTDFDTDVETTTADTELERETDAFETESDLPATGSELPLLALLGLFSVAAAVGVRSFLR